MKNAQYLKTSLVQYLGGTGMSIESIAELHGLQDHIQELSKILNRAYNELLDEDFRNVNQMIDRVSFKINHIDQVKDQAIIRENDFYVRLIFYKNNSLMYVDYEDNFNQQELEIWNHLDGFTQDFTSLKKHFLSRNLTDEICNQIINQVTK
jgi:hypothetical protein